MPVWVISAVRTGVQAAWGAAAAWLLARGVDVPDQAPAWVAPAVLVVVTAAWTALVRWLETRSPRTPEGRAARRLARLLMLGIRQAPTGHGPVGQGVRPPA